MSEPEDANLEVMPADPDTTTAQNTFIRIVSKERVAIIHRQVS
jgi:hypothetical protein